MTLFAEHRAHQQLTPGRRCFFGAGGWTLPTGDTPSAANCVGVTGTFLGRPCRSGATARDFSVPPGGIAKHADQSPSREGCGPVADSLALAARATEGLNVQGNMATRARFFAEHASLQSTLLCALLCRARFFAEHASLQSTLLCSTLSFAEHASLQSTLLCRARSSADMLPGCEGKGGQLWSLAVSSSVFFRGDGGASQLPGCVQTGYALRAFSRRAGWCL